MREDALIVGQEYRTNKLSFEPTDCKVSVEFESGHCFVYNNIHYPYAYVQAICDNHIEYGAVVSMKINGKEVVVSHPDYQEDY